MRNILGKTFRFIGGAVAAATLCGALALGGLGVADANPLSYFTGPAGSNPVSFPAAEADLNTLITNLNTALSPTGIFSSAAFTAGPVGGGAMTLGALKPQTLGSNTVKFFLTFKDSQGVTSFIPVWQ